MLQVDCEHQHYCLGTPRASCVPSEIKGKKSAISKLLDAHERHKGLEIPISVLGGAFAAGRGRDSGTSMARVAKMRWQTGWPRRRRLHGEDARSHGSNEG